LRLSHFDWSDAGSSNKILKRTAFERYFEFW
jgi:hypothetical protein